MSIYLSKNSYHLSWNNSNFIYLMQQLRMQLKISRSKVLTVHLYKKIVREDGYNWRKNHQLFFFNFYKQTNSSFSEKKTKKEKKTSNMQRSCYRRRKAKDFKWLSVLHLFHCQWAWICDPEVVESILRTTWAKEQGKGHHIGN